VDVGHIGDDDGLGHGQEDAPSRTRAGEGVVGSMLGPLVRPERLLRAGSSVEAMPGRCTERRKIPVRLSWRSVVCGERVEHRMPWSPTMQCRVAPQLQCRVAPQLQCTPGALGDSTARPRRCWRPA
jgi:hypothetical protein